MTDGGLTELEAAVAAETVQRAAATVAGLMQCATAALRISEDEAVSELLRAGLDTATAQVEAMNDVLDTVIAEREKRGVDDG